MSSIKQGSVYSCPEKLSTFLLIFWNSFIRKGGGFLLPSTISLRVVQSKIELTKAFIFLTDIIFFESCFALLWMYTSFTYYDRCIILSLLIDAYHLSWINLSELSKCIFKAIATCTNASFILLIWSLLITTTRQID